MATKTFKYNQSLAHSYFITLQWLKLQQEPRILDEIQTFEVSLLPAVLSSQA